MVTYKRFPPSIRQFAVALGPILITICLGMAEGYSSILLPQLEQQQNITKIIIDEELSSWIASIAALPMALGCLLGGYLMEKIGRKATHILACFPCIIGWLCIYFANSVIIILIGRFLTGFCVGLLGPPTGVYMSETSSPRLRGFFLASISFAIAAGLFLSHIIGTFLSWQNTALSCCIFPIFALAVMVFVPESPTWLAKVGKIEQATYAFYWCRGRCEQSEKELNILLNRQDTINTSQYYRELRKPEFVKPLIIIVLFFITCQWSGLNAITFYSIAIIKQTVGGNFDEYLAMLIIDLIRLVMSIIACIALKKLGRRPLAIISGIGTCFSLFALSAFTYIKILYPNYLQYTWIPLMLLVLYVSFITIGFVPLPWTMMGEVFPQSSRGMGSGISALLAYLSFFSVVKTTPFMFTNFGSEGTFLLFGLISFFGTVFLFAFLPETKDKPLYQIEDDFK